MLKITTSDIAAIKEIFNETDNEFIKITIEFFNKVSQDAKVEVDNRLLGATNVESDGNYIPIRSSSDTIYHESGNDVSNRHEFITSMAMNKSTKPGAKK